MLKTNEVPRTEFLEQLTHIEVELLDYPTIEKLEGYIPEFCLATWEDVPGNYSPIERAQAIVDLFGGNLLPTAFETIRLTFRVSGLDLIDVTHLIRHRTLSFSAQCTADRDMRNDVCLVKPSILENKEFIERYGEIVRMAKDLYGDMVDSEEVSILDARTILPRSLSSFYYVSGNIKDILQFIKTRLDEQIQPESDNIVALRMYQSLCKVYPFLKGTIPVGGVDYWYCNTLINNTNSNIYMPKDANKEYLESKGHSVDTNSFVYRKTRNDFPGSDSYRQLKTSILKDVQ